MNFKQSAVLVLFGLAMTFSPIQQAAADPNVLFVFDASGSMKRPLENGETRMQVAKRAMSKALAGISDDVPVGLLLYGHRRAKDCTDIELISPIGADDAQTIGRTIEGLTPLGETPIAEALRKASRNFAALKGQTNRIVLVTDGIEECGGDPCAAARDIVDAGLELKVDVVGFTLTESQAQTVQCIATITGGEYYDARDVKSLDFALTQVAETMTTPPAAPAPPARFNLLDPNEGGQLLSAPADSWLATNDGKEDYVAWMRMGQEGVFAFRDERPATFDTFTVFVGRQDGANLKEFELLVGDEGPGGVFRSIGTFEAQNTKLLKTPHQEFKFAPVTARYLKVKLVSNHQGDGSGYATEFGLYGQLE